MGWGVHLLVITALLNISVIQRTAREFLGNIVMNAPSTKENGLVDSKSGDKAKTTEKKKIEIN